MNGNEIEEEIKSFPIVIKGTDILLPIGEKIWLRYGTGDTDELPHGLLIQNPTVDIGYRNARTGMLLYDIKKNLPAEERIYNSDGTSNYYLHYEDSNYEYDYISADGMDSPTILYIEPKQ